MAEIDARPDIEMTPEQMTPERRQRLGRIQFRAWRRGFREADMVLGPFSDQVAPTLTDAELDQFERLIDEEDQWLYGWIIERDPTPPPALIRSATISASSPSGAPPRSASVLYSTLASISRFPCRLRPRRGRA